MSEEEKQSKRPPSRGRPAGVEPKGEGGERPVRERRDRSAGGGRPWVNRRERLFTNECPRCRRTYLLTFRTDPAPLCPDCYFVGQEVHRSKGFGKGRQEPKRTLKAIRVVCVECGKQDDIPFRIQDTAKTLCNDCYDKSHCLWKLRPMNPTGMGIERMAMKFPCAHCGESSYLYVANESEISEWEQRRDELRCRACRTEKEAADKNEMKEELQRTRVERDGRVIVKK